MIPANTPQEIQSAIQSLDSRIADLETRNIDLRNRRRVINARRAVNEDEFVTLGQVRDMLKDIKATLERLKNVT